MVEHIGKKERKKLLTLPDRLSFMQSVRLAWLWTLTSWQHRMQIRLVLVYERTIGLMWVAPLVFEVDIPRTRVPFRIEHLWNGLSNRTRPASGAGRAAAYSTYGCYGWSSPTRRPIY